jgi:hypothetical protein
VVFQHFPLFNEFIPNAHGERDVEQRIAVKVPELAPAQTEFDPSKTMGHLGNTFE